MAKNLRAKIPMEDTLIVYDVNPQATKSLMSEAPEGQVVAIAETVRELAEKAVSSFYLVTQIPLL